MTPTVDQFRGCLVGECIGDALGAPVEGQDGASCTSYVTSGLMGKLGRGPFAFGQYTDDSQLARELVQSIVERGAFESADYARRVAAIFVEERIVGRGRSTENAARRLAAGVPWDQAGEPPPAAGNGTAMRAGPVGLFCWNDPAALVRIAVDQGRITHADPRCAGGSVAIAGAVMLALRGPIDTRSFATALADLVEPISPITATPIRGLVELVKLSPADALPHVVKLNDIKDNWPGISPYVTVSVIWSLYAFLRAPTDYMAAIATAIAVGGDVDTTAAMTGAIAGAHLGFAALPQNHAAAVNDQNTWRLPELLALCDRLHALAVRNP